MKKAIHFLAFTLLFLPNLFGQKYINETSQWFEVNGDPVDKYINFINIQVAKDTLINNKPYFKMQSTAETIIYTDSLTMWSMKWDPRYWYLREDSSKIYELQNDKDVLIYNFDMEIGDTLHYSGEVIINIDSIYFQNEYRRRYHTYSLSGTIYEGIGGNVGFPYGTHWGPSAFGNVKCYSQNGETINFFEGPHYLHFPTFTIPFSDTCVMLESVYTHIDDFIPGYNELKIYPNPITTTFTIESSEPILSYRIYDTWGRIIKEVGVLNDTVLQCDLTSENTGMYFIEVRTKHAMITQKIMKF